MEQETKQITLGLIIGWILGVLAAITGVTMIFSEPVPGILFILLALVVMPPVSKIVKEKFNFSLSGGMKVVLAIILLGMIGASIDSGSVSSTSSVTNSTGENNQQQETAAAESQTEAVEIVDISTKVTEQNNVWWKYAWNLTLKNNTDREKSVRAEIKWLDAEGFVVDSHTEYSLSVPAGEEKIFSDFALVSTPGASNIEGIKAEIQ
jgi:hypothetical protein